jgi:hypothetical protein
LPDGKGRIAGFTCFAYALGVWNHPDFIKKVDEANHSSIISSRTVQTMIEDGIMTPVAEAKARTGDVVVYFNNGIITHAAVIGRNEMYRSKWGGNEVHAHGLWEVPAQYGDRVCYYRAPEISTVLMRIPAAPRAS